MDALASIMTALVSGAAAGLQPTVTQAITDSYSSLKSLIKRKYTKVNVEQLEENPTSSARRAVVEEDLARTEAGGDEELLRASKALLDAIQSQVPATAVAAGVDLEDIKGTSLTIEDIMATGVGVRGAKIEVRDDIVIKGVRTSGSGELHPKV